MKPANDLRVVAFGDQDEMILSPRQTCNRDRVSPGVTGQPNWAESSAICGGVEVHGSDLDAAALR
jgi:hypothetical protein